MDYILEKNETFNGLRMFNDAVPPITIMSSNWKRFHQRAIRCNYNHTELNVEYKQSHFTRILHPIFQIQLVVILQNYAIFILNATCLLFALRNRFRNQEIFQQLIYRQHLNDIYFCFMCLIYHTTYYIYLISAGYIFMLFNILKKLLLITTDKYKCARYRFIVRFTI